MYNLAWDFYQQRQITDLTGDIARSRTESQQRVRELEDRIDRLALINTALWELSLARLGITQEQIEAKVREVDLRDGRLDGRLKPTSPPLACAACGRTLMARHRRCLYCGQEHAPDTSTAV